jgi:YHS domain-containing protein
MSARTADSRHVVAPVVQHDRTTAVDPVCGMAVDKATAPATREFKGRTYYFCTEGCAQSFSENPTRYVGTGAAIDPV